MDMESISSVNSNIARQRVLRLRVHRLKVHIQQRSLFPRLLLQL